jgi:hypothetical protein
VYTVEVVYTSYDQDSHSAGAFFIDAEAARFGGSGQLSLTMDRFRKTSSIVLKFDLDLTGADAFANSVAQKENVVVARVIKEVRGKVCSDASIRRSIR